MCDIFPVVLSNNKSSLVTPSSQVTLVSLICSLTTTVSSFGLRYLKVSQESLLKLPLLPFRQLQTNLRVIWRILCLESVNLGHLATMLTYGGKSYESWFSDRFFFSTKRQQGTIQVPERKTFKVGLQGCTYIKIYVYTHICVCIYT